MTKLLLIALLLTGCSFGPFHIEKKDNAMPQGYIDIPAEGRLTMHNYDEINLFWELEF